MRGYERAGSIVGTVLMFAPKIIIIISAKNRKSARRKLSAHIQHSISLPCFRPIVGTVLRLVHWDSKQNARAACLPNNDVHATNIFGGKASQGSVFSNYSYYEHFFSFCLLFLKEMFAQTFQRKTMQIGCFYFALMSKLKVSVREDNNLYKENFQQEKYPHNYVRNSRHNCF